MRTSDYGSDRDQLPDDIAAAFEEALAQLVAMAESCANIFAELYELADTLVPPVLQPRAVKKNKAYTTHLHGSNPFPSNRPAKSLVRQYTAATGM